MNHTAKENSQSNCEKCDKSYEESSIQNLSEHENVTTERSDTPPEINENCYVCGECTEQFSSFNECQKHIETHPYKCYRCNFKSLIENEMKEHEYKEHEDEEHENKEQEMDPLNNKSNGEKLKEHLSNEEI